MKRPSARRLKIAITTGDSDGIGSEIASKALAKLRRQPGVSFYLWRSPQMSTRQLRLIDRHFKRIVVSNWPEALKVNADSSRILIDINSNLPPPTWVETAARASLFGHLDCLVTAPLSKTAIVSAGLNDMGHTGILQRVCEGSELFMGFIGDKFNVLLATAHIPISKVTQELTAARLESALQAAEELRLLLPRQSQKQPLALLGLNPHGGEEGLIGDAEARVHRAALTAALDRGLRVEGPLVPDAAFFRANWAKYAVFVANYHDQGLIPFKMIHGQESGIQVTMGLPFVRTSVDHGTAKNIFGQNKADARSMTLAIEWALRLGRLKIKAGPPARL